MINFGTFTLTRIDPKYSLLSYASGILILAIIMIVASALFSLWAFKTERYNRVLSDTIFFLGKNIDERSIQQWENANPAVLQKRMVRDYIRCNRVNNECNASKSRKITWAQVFLIIGIGLIPVILGILFHAYVSGAIHLDQPSI